MAAVRRTSERGNEFQRKKTVERSSAFVMQVFSRIGMLIRIQVAKLIEFAPAP